MIRQPARSTRTETLFPYTSLFRSIDCAMTDGSALLAGMSWGFLNTGRIKDEAGVNMLDTGAHFYDTYTCADGKRSEEHTSELPSLISTSYAVFCLQNETLRNGRYRRTLYRL